MKFLRNHVPSKPVPTTLLQAKIDTKLFEKAKALKAKTELTWEQLIEGLLKAYIEEFDS